LQSVHDGALRFEYDLRPLPLGRFTFRRWRWELWRGAVLRASGWRTTPFDAQRALRTAASYWAHDEIGLTPIRPEHSRARDRFVPGATVRIDCGAVACVLLPRGAAEA
jgi:hypothetical protein